MATTDYLPAAPPPIVFQSFPTGSIQYCDGPLKASFEANRKYLKELDSDMLLYAYRFFAYRKTPGKPSGGWEYPLDASKGTFLGHYLSAAAQTIAATQDADLKKKADAIVDDLRETQLTYGGKWVQATGPERVYVLEGKRKGDADFPVIAAPYYQIHKLLMGLLDMHRLTGSEPALVVGKGLADFMVERCEALSDEELQKILEREHGGIEEVFFQYYETTRDARYLRLGKRLEHQKFTSPLAKGEDNLADLHANTQLPKLIGEAKKYELTGDERSRKLVEFAWSRIADSRAYCTGGSSSKEYWRAPNALKDTLCNETQESCTTYNWIKLTRHLYRWTGDPKYGDRIEQAFLNGILPAQNPSTGMFVYFLPLTQGGSRKAWGTPTDSFWCCYGTMVESFSSLVDNAYFHTDDSLLVNLYVPSSVTWNGMTLEQSRFIPESDVAKIEVRLEEPKKQAIGFRIPAWTTAEAQIVVNGKPAGVKAVPGSIATVDRTWKSGDVVEVKLPMALSYRPINDDPQLVALTYGPVVLGGLTDKPVELSTPLNATPAGNLQFDVATSAGRIRFVPLYRIIDEAYGVYFHRK